MLGLRITNHDYCYRLNWNNHSVLTINKVHACLRKYGDINIVNRDIIKPKSKAVDCFNQFCINIFTQA